MARSSYEVVIVGSGIAGASLSYFLAQAGITDVLLLEREDNLAVHSTGRSAATLCQIDPVPTLQAILGASAPFFRSPPPGFSENPILQRTGALTLLDEQELEEATHRLPEYEALGLDAQTLSPDQCAGIVDAIDPSTFAGGLLVPDDGRIDVHELLSSYLRHARSAGVELRLSAGVQSVVTHAGRCSGVVVDGEEIGGRVVVDAAGAWAGSLAALAGASAVPMTPRRRTIVTYPWPRGLEPRTWPFLVSEVHQVYFTPEAGDLLLCAMDEHDMEPCDPNPQEEVIAAAIERLRTLAPDLVPSTIRRRWSGLRTFSPDRVHVVGEDPVRPGFFWLAGQGGCGIGSSPLIGQVAADLIASGETRRFDASLLAPERFGSHHVATGGAA